MGIKGIVWVVLCCVVLGVVHRSFGMELMLSAKKHISIIRVISIGC